MACRRRSSHGTLISFLQSCVPPVHQEKQEKKEKHPARDGAGCFAAPGFADGLWVGHAGKHTACPEDGCIMSCILKCGSALDGIGNSVVDAGFGAIA